VLRPTAGGREHEQEDMGTVHLGKLDIAQPPGFHTINAL
jgi:hypothetical protein